jgi:hypothetical protein
MKRVVIHCIRSSVPVGIVAYIVYVYFKRASMVPRIEPAHSAATPVTPPDHSAWEGGASQPGAYDTPDVDKMKCVICIALARRWQLDSQFQIVFQTNLEGAAGC